MKILPLCVVGVLLFSVSAMAQSKNYNSSKSNTSGIAVSDEVRCNGKDDDCDGTGGTNTQSTERKKMEILKPVDVGPLELIDETDPCPTLPC